MKPEDFFDSFNNTPLSAMQERTPATDSPANDLSGLFDHTKLTSDHITQTTPPPLATGGGPVKDSTYQNGNGNIQSAGSLIPASLAIELLDMIVPVALVLLMERLLKKRVQESYLHATPEEKQLIEPVLQKYLDSINVKVTNPFNALLIVCACVYGPKLIEVINQKKPPSVSRDGLQNFVDSASTGKRGRPRGSGNKNKIRDYARENQLRREREAKRRMAENSTQGF